MNSSDLSNILSLLRKLFFWEIVAYCFTKWNSVVEND